MSGVWLKEFRDSARSHSCWSIEPRTRVWHLPSQSLASRVVYRGLVLKPEIRAGVLKGLVAGEPQEQAGAEGRDVRSMLVATRNTVQRETWKKKAGNRDLKRVLLLSYGKIETLGKRSKVLLQDGCLYSRRFYEAEWGSQTHTVEKAFWMEGAQKGWGDQRQRGLWNDGKMDMPCLQSPWSQQMRRFRTGKDDLPKGKTPHTHRKSVSIWVYLYI